MKILGLIGKEEIACVYLAEMGEGRVIEFVESLQPPLPRERKWVLMVSTLFGCPIQCLMCDAGSAYQGSLSAGEILAQIDYLVEKRFPSGEVPVKQFKIQFARMGEPALNPEVLEVLRELPERYRAPGLMPSFSTVAPRGREGFFEELREIKDSLYAGGRFQFQFSIHTTSEALRKRLIPAKSWGFSEMAAYGERFYAPGDRKITLNFTLAQGMPVAAPCLKSHFDPERFLIKITPVNPTYQARQNGLSSYLDPLDQARRYELVEELKEEGYEVLVSIGEPEENRIGSNCGQYVTAHFRAKERLADGYHFSLEGAAPGEEARGAGR